MGDHSINSNGQGSRRGGRKRVLDEEHLTEEEKAKKQKNRDAAKKCRLRKLEEAKTLKKDNEKLESENRKLTKKKSELESNIAKCKRIIEHHEQHGCQLPEELKRLLYDDCLPDTDINGDFCPVGIRTVGDSATVSSIFQTDSQIPLGENTSTVEIPTGLFSGTQLQMTQDKLRKDTSIVKNLLPSSGHDITIADSQSASKLQNSNSYQTPHFQWIEVGDGQSQSSSPAQRVPNIDQVSWSPQPLTKVNDIDDNREDDNISPIMEPQQTNIIASHLPTTAFNHLSGGHIVSNVSTSLSQANSNVSHVKNIRLTHPNSSPSVSSLPSQLYSKGILQKRQTSFPVTESLQATTELISQAIQDISPLEISKTLQDQIIECAKPESNGTTKVAEDQDYMVHDSPITPISVEDHQEEGAPQTQQQFSFENKPVQTILMQTENGANSNINLPVSVDSYSFYNNDDHLNASIVRYPNDLVTGSQPVSQYNQAQYIAPSYVIDRQVGLVSQQLITVPLVITSANPIQQAQMEEEEVQVSQIPTTVLSENDDDDVVYVSSSENRENATSQPAGQDGENAEPGSLANIRLKDYSDVVSELPSLSFNDLKNQPKEIFNKKPSRLTGKSSQ